MKGDRKLICQTSMCKCNRLRALFKLGNTTVRSVKYNTGDLYSFTNAPKFFTNPVAEDVVYFGRRYTRFLQSAEDLHPIPVWTECKWLLQLVANTPASRDVQEICTLFRFGRNANGSCSCLQTHLLPAMSRRSAPECWLSIANLDNDLLLLLPQGFKAHGKAKWLYAAVIDRRDGRFGS